MAGEALMGDGGGPGGSGRRTPRVTQGRGGRGTRPRFPGTGPTVTQGRGGQGPGPRFPGTGPRITGTNAARGAGIFKRIKDFIKPIPFLLFQSIKALITGACSSAPPPSLLDGDQPPISSALFTLWYDL